MIAADPRIAFTLIELLVVVTIITLLLALLFPALRSVRSQVNALQCASHLKNISFEFQLFAMGSGERARSESALLGPKSFRIDDFQEMLYGIDEFWNPDDGDTATLDAGKNLMQCTAGAPTLIKRRGRACGREAIGPIENVSMGFNLRLRRGTVRINEFNLLAPVAASHLRNNVLDHPSVPLVMDVDGELAAMRGFEPFYIAPPVADKEDPFADGGRWMPSRRHNGRTQVGFVGGHVLSSENPAHEPWDWTYQSETGR